MDARDCARIPLKTYDAVGVVKEETTEDAKEGEETSFFVASSEARETTS